MLSLSACRSKFTHVNKNAWQCTVQIQKPSRNLLNAQITREKIEELFAKRMALSLSLELFTFSVV